MSDSLRLEREDKEGDEDNLEDEAESVILVDGVWVSRGRSREGKDARR